jgi:hypothetical protein
MRIVIKIIALIIVFQSCKIFKPTLLPPTVKINTSISNYKYAIIPNFSDKNSNTSLVYSGSNISNTILTQSINPRDIISGFLLKKGFIILPELKDDLLEKTVIVNYGESGKRMTGLGGYTLEATITFVSAKSFNIISSCSAEGQGSSESDDLRIAITRCLNSLFQ